MPCTQNNKTSQDKAHEFQLTVGGEVCAPWVRQVLAQGGQRALAGGGVLADEADHGNHGEATVLDLLELVCLEALGVLGEAEGVEGTAWVELALGVGVLSAETLGHSESNELLWTHTHTHTAQ